MHKTIISKQFALSARDWLKSGYYAIVVPILFEVQGLLGTVFFNIEGKGWHENLAKIAVSAIIAHLLRKASEKTKKIDIQTFSDDLPQWGGDDKDKTNPPPIGDPTKPKK